MTFQLLPLSVKPSLDILQRYGTRLRRSLGKECGELGALPEFSNFPIKGIGGLDEVLLSVAVDDDNGVGSGEVQQLVDAHGLLA